MSPILSTALQTTDHVKDAAATTRRSFVALGAKTRKLVKAMHAFLLANDR